MDMLWDVILDSLIDSVKLLPFLFVTYVVMEYLEHKTGSRMQDAVRRAGKAGPVIGSVLGVFPPKPSKYPPPKCGPSCWKTKKRSGNPT